MATPNRASLISKTAKVLKKHYKPVPVATDRPVLEQLLFACCLENAPYEAAEQTFAALETDFFDLNEVRVSTVKELAEVMRGLPDPQQAAANLKRSLQSVFESTYSFELESFKKQNIGQAVAKLKKIGGTTPFTVSYVTQVGLGGHAIPVDRGAMEALIVIGVVSESEAADGSVPGLERAIPKNKGLEFASLLHQLSADFTANPYAPALHKILLEISPQAKDRLPKRRSKKALAAAAQKEKEAAAEAGAKKKTAKKQPAAMKAAKKSTPAKKKKKTSAKPVRRKHR